LYRRDGQWLENTWAIYMQMSERLAAGLHSLGVRAGDRVAILANTRMEWAFLDMAILGIGAVTVPIYPSSSHEDVEFILKDSEAKILIVDSATVLMRLRRTLENINTLEHQVIIDKPSANHPLDFNGPATTRTVHTFAGVMDLGIAQLTRTPRLYKETALKISPDDIATILYTSGTTGRPKGVVLLHSAIMSEVSEVFPLLGVTPRDRSLSFLPFAHILGRIEIWGHVFIGYQMAFAEGIERLRENLQSAQPTLMVAVPRVFEKLYSSVLSQAEVSPVRKRVFDWAISVGREISRYKVDKKPVPVDLALKYQLAHRLVFKKLAEKMGGRLRFVVSGGAPLSPAIAEFFHAAGLLILEGYGLTETTAAVTVNTPFDYRFGSVGKPIGDVRIRIADDGEILIKSKKLMREYYNQPESTAETLVDGWFHTGDIGELSPEGYLRITDRKKDLIKTAGGKYVAPQKLERLLKSNNYVSNVHIHGDQQKYVVALLTLNIEAIQSYAEHHDLSYSDLEALSQHPRIRELVRQAVADANSLLASFESIKNFAVLPKDFTVESGELTPSLKVKRKVVDERYRSLIERLYGVERGA